MSDAPIGQSRRFFEAALPTRSEPGRINLVAKRLFDIVGAAILLMLVAPFMVVIALLVRRDGGSALYSHRRVGRGGHSFGCLKFRSMVVDSERQLAAHLAANPEAANEWQTRRKLSNDPRITRIGAFLRKTSLDELPQLINVLRGEMSLVGPRPVVPDELNSFYCARGAEAYRKVRPGITGLWQISGRSDTSYARRVALDIHYVERLSVLHDVSILVRTLPAVLLRRGAV